jgi:nucleoside phosphorylase
MTYIVAALRCEVEFLFELFDLKRVESTPFSIYLSKELALTISKVGKINSAIATVNLLNRFLPKESDKILNLGVAGSKKEIIGTLHEVSKIIDFSSKRVYHLDKKGSTSVTSVDIADNYHAIKSDLIDMEASGFYQGAKLFFDSKDISILKVVSDNLNLNSLDRSFVESLMRDKKREIVRFI